MLKELKSQLKYFFAVAFYKEADLPTQTDDEKRAKTSILHGNLIGFFIWFASLEKIEIVRTTGNESKGDASVKSQEDAIKFASILKERYYIYNKFDLADLDDIEFRKLKSTDLRTAKKIAEKNKRWYFTTGIIPASVLAFFASKNIQCQQHTSKEDAIAYLTRDR